MSRLFRFWCPDNCSGGDAHHLIEVLPDAFNKMTEAAPLEVPTDASTWRCRHCGCLVSTERQETGLERSDDRCPEQYGWGWMGEVR